MPKPIIRAADLFAGAGGFSTGLARAAQALGRRLELVAVNHWPVAVETHAANHPRARHYCEPVDAVNPRQAVPSGKLDLLLAGPSCTHHSTARGGKPVNDQHRASAWCILRWATDLMIDTILIENVKEFASWGPLGANGRPLKSRRGLTFHAFIEALKSLGYRVNWRVLNAADYGDPTTRERLFIQARRGRRPITWPEPTHSPDGRAELYGRRAAWVPARRVIDWSLRGTSIFQRPRPLSPNTIARIAAGLRKFGGKNAEPFLVMLYGSNNARGIDRPLPTVTAQGQHIGLCEPFLVPTNYGERPGQSPRCHGLDKPMPTVVGSATHALVEPFIVHTTHDGRRRPNGLGEPLPTVTGAHRGEMALVEPFLMSMSQSGSNGDRLRPATKPMPTVTTADDLAVVEPFLVKYNGQGGGPRSVDEPLDTISTRDRFGLVETGRPVLDILFRMLQPHELARAMSFPAGYKFAGNREDRVRQIGNAVAGRIAEALCWAVLE